MLEGVMQEVVAAVAKELSLSVNGAAATATGTDADLFYPFPLQGEDGG